MRIWNLSKWFLYQFFMCIGSKVHWLSSLQNRMCSYYFKQDRDVNQTTKWSKNNRFQRWFVDCVVCPSSGSGKLFLVYSYLDKRRLVNFQRNIAGYPSEIWEKVASFICFSFKYIGKSFIDFNSGRCSVTFIELRRGSEIEERQYSKEQANFIQNWILSILLFGWKKKKKYCLWILVTCWWFPEYCSWFLEEKS